MNELLTPRELARDYKLDMFYQPATRNIIIPDDYCTEEINAHIREFLQDNADWVLGHEETYWYLSRADEVN